MLPACVAVRGGGDVLGRETGEDRDNDATYLVEQRGRRLLTTQAQALRGMPSWAWAAVCCEGAMLCATLDIAFRCLCGALRLAE